MAFCISCGKRIEAGSVFCAHCGARQDASAGPGPSPPSPAPPQQQPAPAQAPPPGQPAGSFYSTAAVQSPQSSQGGYAAARPDGAGGYGSATAAPAAPRKPMPIGIKILIIAVIVVAALIALFIFVMGKLHDPQKTISAFVESVMAQDYEQFVSVTVPAGQELELTEEAVAPFFELYSGRLSTLEDYQESLEEDLRLLRQGRLAVGNGLIRLVEHDKILFKTYEVEISGMEASFSTNLDGAAVTVGGKTLTLGEAGQEEELFLLPGVYDVEAAYTDPVFGERFSTRIKDCELTPSDSSVYLNIEYGSLWLADVGMEIASLTVNGKEYGPVEFDANGEFAIAPLPQDFELQVTYNAGGVALTAGYTWADSYCWDHFYPEPAVSRETAMAMLDQAGELVRSMVDAYNAGSVETLRAADPYGRSPVMSFYLSELEHGLNMEAYSRIRYYYNLRELEGDLGWTRDYDIDGLGFSTLIFLGLDYSYEHHLNGQLEDLSTELYPDDNVLRLFVQRIDGQWVVSGLEYASGFTRGDIYDPYPM